MTDIVDRLRTWAADDYFDDETGRFNEQGARLHEAADEIERLREMWKPMPRGGMEHDWEHWSIVYQRRQRRLKKLIAAQGYDILSDEDGMPTALERNKP